MRTLILSISCILISCSSVPERTKWTDKTMRVMVDPGSVPTAQYVRLVQSLVASGKWDVVDRAQGMQAVMAEQERLHRVQSDRFDDAQKWAMWGKMYGVGGVIVANTQCEQHGTALLHLPYIVCNQSLTLVDANTAVVVSAIHHRQEGETNELYVAPPWDDAVDKLNHAFPADYKPADIQQYAEDVKKHAQEQKRSLASEPVKIIIEE